MRWATVVMLGVLRCWSGVEFALCAATTSRTASVSFGPHSLPAAQASGAGRNRVADHGHRLPASSRERLGRLEEAAGAGAGPGRLTLQDPRSPVYGRRHGS
jgi:hypothetical protein